MAKLVRTTRASVAAVILLLSVAACTQVARPSVPDEAATAASVPTGSSIQAPEVVEPDTPDLGQDGPDVPAATGIELDSQGHVAKSLGESGELLGSSGTVEFTIDVLQIEVMEACPGSMAVPPTNGYYVVLDVEVALSAGAGVDLILIGPSQWAISDGDSSPDLQLETDAAWLCYETSERLPYTIAPNELLRGRLVLDSAVPLGRVAFAPSGSAGWSWEFKRSGD